MDLNFLLRDLVDRGAVDIFIISGRQISFKKHGQIGTYTDERVLPAQTEEIIKQIYEYTGRDIDILLKRGDDDFSFAIKGVSRFRINAYRQRGSYAAVIRVVGFELPDASKLNVPEEILKLSERQRGLILVTGSTSSGKTTTLTCILDRINQNRNSHIVTLEDPIEFLHSHKKSIFSQREVTLDTDSYLTALRAALRQSPDVIFIGELRDSESISIALTAAETGHLVFSALHTLGAANAIDRLVDTFPSSQQNQVRMQLSMALQTVVCQQLVPTLDGKMFPVFEIMHCNNAIRTLIRDGRTHQINSVIQSSSAEGMVSMDSYLTKLFKDGVISKQTAFDYSLTPEFLVRQIGAKDAK